MSNSDKTVKIRHSKDFKVKVVNTYLQDKLSARETADIYGIHHSVVARWVAKYQEGGLEALENRRRGSKPKDKPTTHEELLKQLKYLEMENEILKKLQELQRRNAQLRKRSK